MCVFTNSNLQTNPTYVDIVYQMKFACKMKVDEMERMKPLSREIPLGHKGLKPWPSKHGTRE